LASNYTDFWFPGNVDSTLWWTLACLKLVQLQPQLKSRWQPEIEKSLLWLRYQDVAEVGLIMQGHCSDWEDELPNHGAVLYSNALWFKVVSEYLAVYGSNQLIDQEYCSKLELAFNQVFWPYTEHETEVANKAMQRSIEWAHVALIKQPYYISYLSRRAYGRRCDVLGNILTMLFGLASPERAAIIERFLWSIQTSPNYPGKSLYPVIYPGEEEWQAGMATRNQNLPHQYHNGGIWPYIGGFWVTYLATRPSTSAASQAQSKLGAAGTVDTELLRLAQANALNQWEFNEYLHGELGTPMGIPYQSWNAASFALAYRAVVNGSCILQAAKPKRATKPLEIEPTGVVTRLQQRFIGK
jgi:hypothetical protein